MVFGTEDIPVGGKIDAHRHPGSDEILFLQNGSAKVSVGDKTGDVHGGATVFIPAGTWISAANHRKGSDPRSVCFLRAGF